MGETDVVGHEGEGYGARKCDSRRKLTCKKINHGDGEGAKDQGDDAEVSFGFGEGVEKVSEDEEEGRMKEAGILFIKFYLAFEIISRIIEGMDLIHPE